MKKLLISLVFLIPFVTGCSDIDTRININPDKSASIVSSVTYKGDLSNKNDIVGQTISNNYKNLLDKYYNVDVSTGKSLSTVTATKKISNIEHDDIDIESLGFRSNLPSGKFIDVKKNFLVKSYNVDMTFNYNDVKSKLTIPETNVLNKGDDNTLDPEYYHKYMDREDTVVRDNNDNVAEYDMAANLDESAKQLAYNGDTEIKKDEKTGQHSSKSVRNNLTLSIQLPSFASYNNADIVEDNVYSWNIKTDEPTVIKLQYVQYSGWALCVIIFLGFLLLLYIARRIIRRDSTKRIDNIENIV